MRSETSPAIADLDSELVAELRRLLATETGRAVSAIGDEEVREAYGRALATDQDDLAEPSLERMFESRARQQAGEVAVLFRGEPVAYAELDRRANRLARFLRRRGVGPETLVGIALPPSTDRAMALLGVLKAGGAFVPIAPGRRGTALRAAARPLLTLTAEPLDGNGVIVLPQVRETIERESEESLADVAGPENLVAVVEDGAGHLVLVERRHLLNRLEGLEAEIELDSSDVLLHSGGEDADWEILWALLYGGRLAIAEASPAALDELGVTILRLTPTRLSALLAKGRAPLGALRAVLCGGEALRADLAVRFAERSAARLVHFYAAAEAAAEVSFHASSGRANRDPLPVGDTFNLSVFLLDPYLKPVPQGLPGEIHLAAPELPRGFLGDPCATALAFLPNPLAGEPGSRMLRTGDLGRLLPEGALALAGAAGRQVWIGGRRLDLGAVEVELLLEPSIVEAAVLVREEAAAIQIVAYLVVAGAWAPERYAERLRWRWPEELLPAAWIPLSRLPLTPTGRLDEAALLRLPVIDGELIAHWEESLCALPEIREAAVVVRETADTLPPLHFDDLLPGWKSIAAGSADTAGAAPAGETTAGGAATAPEAPGVPAIAHGPALALPTGAPVTLPEALERAALEHPENGITYLRSDGSAACQTYPELLEASQRLLAGLRELGLKPQDKLLFQLPDLADFVVAFWAAMLGGFVPVPLSIPPTYEQANSALDKLANAWRMLDRPWILCGRETLPAVHSLSDLLDLDGLRVAAVDDLQRAAPDREPHPCRPDDLALLLLTSGSTGMPKAVTQTHRALLIRSAATARHNGFTPEDVSLNWMPLDHVGGIVMFNLRDVYVGCRQVHAPTAAVLAGPLLWLDWMERFRATATWAPNFAFGLVNDRAGEIARRRWDLSSMRFILNAGEAIVAKTARTFLSLLAPHGLPATAMKPAWGMSETCSAITFSHDFTLDSTHDADSFVEVGVPIPEAAVRIVDADHHVVPEGTIGHLQVQGPMITTGYYRRPELNGEVFAPGGWFDTGDLGVLRNGQLSITGRAKDVIIVRGVNYYSHEIEAVIEEIPGVEVSFTAACPVRPPGSDTDELAIFFHTPSEDWERRIELIREIRNRVAEKSGVNPTYVIPMAREEIPKTAIGKIQRPHLRQQLEAGQLQDVLKRIDLLTGSARTLPAWFYERVWRPREPSARPAARPAGRWLIFLDPHGLGADLCRRLERQGHTCITVEIAGEYRQIDARRFVLDPGQAEHYRRLLQSLASPEDPVERVVHLWTSGERADKIDSLEALERAQERGVYSVLFLVQALVEAQGEERAVELAVVSSRAQLTGPSDRLAAAGACLPGLLKTIPLELPAIHCRHIDLELGRAEADGWRLLGELDLPTAEAEVAYRDGRRLVPVLTRADIGQKERGGPAITPGGLYLVTGGLGGIGSRLAQLLHRSFGARLLLVGRTALPEPAAWARCLADGQTVLARRISAHMALARAGAEFLYRAVDVVDGAGLEQAVAEAEATWQRPLDGIFHLAGILDESDLEDHWTVSERHRVAAETRETLARMLAPKVQGTWTLGRLLVERPTALFVAFSSVNSLFGGSTFSAYAAANSFVDAWTLDRRYRGRPAQCFNWTMWDDLGMSQGNPAFARDAARAAGYHVLSPERGFFSLLAGLEYGAAQLVVGLDGDNRHLRHRILTAACERQELAAFFTGPAEAGRLQELSVKDRFGTPSASRFRRLAEMPRTTAGDVDRERLIVLVEKERKTGPAERAAPQNEIERQLAEIWQQVLGTPSPVGTHDNFFHLGGDSILSIQVLARAAEKGLRLTPKQIFQHPTIAELAAVVELTGPRAAEQELVTGEVPLTPIQRWFFEQDLPEPHHFNMALLLTALQPLDGELLERAFAHLALHHDALRMRYRRLGDGWQQVNAGTEERRWASVVTLADEPPAEQQRAITTHAGRLQASLSLTDGPLLRVTYFDLGPGEPGRLLIVVHHLVIDGVAWRILLHDLQVAYGQLRAGNEVRLAPKTTSFQHWSMRLNEIGRSADWTAEESYWLAEPRPRISSLPVDSGDGENTEGSAHRSTVHLDAGETRALLQEVPKAYRTQINDVLLTALAQVLTAWTSARAVLVDLEGHGREELFDDVDLSRTVGWFTTLFPMLLELAPDTPPGAALKSVKEQLRAVPQRGIGYGLLRYRGDEVAAALARLPPAEVSFNYLGQIDQVLAQSETFAAGREPIGDFSSPAGKRRHRLDVVAHVMEGCLEVGWIYSRNVHRDATVERLAQDFIAALRTLIDHCLTSATGGATPSDFPLARLDQGQVDRLIGGERDVADVYPLSSTQQGMLFHALYSPESAMYFDQASWKLKGALDVASLAEAWRMVIDRHAILRTGFVWLDLDRPLQVVRQRVDLPLRLEDWRQMPADESRLAALLAHDRELGFDLGQAPLMRLKLVRLEADHYHLVWTRHHILLDGWTQAIVLKEVFACYEARRHSRPPELGRPIPYRDYVAWLERQNLEEAESYWRRTLAGFTTATRLMELGQRESAALPGEECDAELHRLSPDLTARLQMQAQRHRLTLNTLVQGAWGRLLCCYSGEEDVVFGSTFAGRPADLPGVESMVGLFINTLPVRMTVPDQEPLLVWLQRLQEQQIERRQYEHTPLTQVQRWSEIPPGQLLFESLYVFENFPVDASLGKGVGGLEVEAVETAVRTNYPLTLVAVPGDELALRTYFDATRVDGQKVRRLLGHLSTFLAGVTEGLERRIADVPLLSVEERRQLVTEWNALAPEHDSATPMARKVEAQVAQHGDKAAVILGTGPGRRQLTYRELDQRSNRLARFLRRRSVGPDTLVGVSLPPSPDRVVALLGILKAGGAFVPLAPGRRGAALRAMAKPAFVLNAEPPAEEGVIVLSEVQEEIDREDDFNLEDQAQPENLAGVVFDGTGRGLLVERRHLLNRLERLQDEIELREADVLLHSGGEDADWEIFWTLLHGGCLVMGADPTPAVIGEHGVTLLRLTPTRLSALLADREAPLDGLRAVLCGGEALRSGLAASFAERSPARLIHLYSPPEAGAEVCFYTISAQESRDPVPVGDRFNLSVLLLDSALQLVSPGLPGEIHLAAPELPRGFLADPCATALSFVPDPFAEEPGRRLLRTGDLGRRLPDGALALTGTTGRQAWIGGFRLDLGAIEAELLAEPAVAEAAVLVRETTAATQQLVAYLAVSGAWVPERYAERVRQRWPDELLPSIWIPLSRLPLTPAGRLDEPALLRLPAIDGELTMRWEESLSSLPGVEDAAVLVGETSEALPPFHLDDLLPGWRSTATGSGGTDGVTPPMPALQVASAASAVCYGPALVLPADAPKTLAGALERAARLHPERGVTYLAPDGSKTFQSYPELLLAAQRLLAGLRELGLKPRDKVLFQLGQLDDFVVAFWASVLGGFVPVPLSIAPSYEQPNSALDKLANAWRMLGQPLILCSRELLSAVRSLSGLLGLPGLRAEAVDALRRHEPDRECHTCREDDLALLLLTSGSTGLPKAVMQTHQALLTRCASTAQNNDFTPEDVSLNWMPLDHVGGIVMFHLRDVYVGCRQVHAPITAVLEDPLRWLDWIERFRATVTWAPNFAFGLVNDRAAEIARRSWDLSSMRFILNAGEAIVAKTARTFLQILEPHALPGTAMKPAWGMSETCSAITFSQDFTLASTSNTDSFVEVGSPVPAAAVRIVDAENRVVAEGTIGRLQVKGPMITGGYYQRPELDSEVFTADGWFDTGDLGVLRNHRLSITGRAKDVIIVHGINYYSHEIESVVEEVSGVEVSYTAACPVRMAGSDTDELAIFFHTSEEDWERRLSLIEEIRQRVTEKSGLNPTYVIPMAREDIPKTAIGKIQRPQLRQQLEAGKLADVLKRIDLLTGSPRTLPAWFYRRVWRPRERAPRTAVQPGGRWLIFLDPHGLGADLCRRLARRGQTSIEVALGPEYRQIDAHHFVLNPGQADHYRWLLQSLVSRQEPIDRVVHLWTAGDPAAEVVSLETLRRAQERGVLSVLFLVQALVEARGDRQPMELSVVSRHAQVTQPSDRLLGDGASLPGLLKTIPLELPAIRCRHIDLEVGRAEEDGRRLLRELDLPGGEAEVAYRGEQRLVPVLVRADLLQEERGEMPIVPGGLYLVTGGLGGIGSRLAQFLHRSFGARLLLVGRTALPEPAQWPLHLREAQTPLARRISAHLALDKAGVDFTYRAVDVVDQDGLTRAVAEAEATWGRPLDGIFHLAGAAGETDLEEHWTVAERHQVATETRPTFDRIFASKVYGTWSLCQLLVDRPQALLVAFSSVNSLFGGATFCAYSAANSFLDACILHQHQSGRRAYGFNWAMWDDLGMSRGTPAFARDAAHAAGYHILSPERGFYSLLAGLERAETQLVVGLDSDNRHLRHHVLATACERQNLTAFFTGPAETSHLQELAVRDRFGSPSACQLHRLAEMPRTAAGEIDRERLIALGDRARMAGPAERVAPRTEIERQLAEIWQQVLGTGSPVGIDDNFFQLGGDSILSIQILARAAERGLHLTPKQIFQHPTIAELAAEVEVPTIDSHPSPGMTAVDFTAQELAGFKDRLLDAGIATEPIESAYPLSPMQHGMLFLARQAPGAARYFEQFYATFRGAFDPPTFGRAWQRVVDRHPELRTAFVWSGLAEPLQVVHRSSELPLEQLAWLDASPAEQELRFAEYLATELQRGCELSRPPLLRLGLIQLSADTWRFVWGVHHLLVDGWSAPLVLQEVFTVYTALRLGQEPPASPPRPSYRSYIAWLRQQDRSRAEAFWRRQLTGFTAPTPLGIDRSPGAVPEQERRGERRAQLGAATSHALRELARQNGLTLNTLMQGAWALLLASYSGTDDVVFGTTVSGRPPELPGVESMLGMLINTLPLRVRIEPDQPLLTWFAELQAAQVEAREHEHTPLVDVQGWSAVPRGQPLFESLLVFENAPFDDSLAQTLGEVEISRAGFSSERASYPLAWIVSPSEEILIMAFYDRARIADEVVAQVLEHWQALLRDVVTHPAGKLGEMSVIATVEQETLSQLSTRDQAEEFNF